MTSDRVLLFMLRANALVLILAAPCALFPFEWMDTVHRDWLGLGSLHDSPLMRYLTRSLSLTCALHGALLLAVTLNWARHRPLVPVIAWLHIAFGCAMLAVGSDADLPNWWIASEGPVLVVYGIAMLILYRRASYAGTSVS
jgi:hypothetical protein